MTDIEQSTTTTDITDQVGTAGATVKSGIISSLKGIEEIEAEIVTLVRKTVSGTIKTVRSESDMQLASIDRSAVGDVKPGGSLIADHDVAAAIIACQIGAAGDSQGRARAIHNHLSIGIAATADCQGCSVAGAAITLRIDQNIAAALDDKPALIGRVVRDTTGIAAACYLEPRLIAGHIHPGVIGNRQDTLAALANIKAGAAHLPEVIDRVRSADLRNVQR